MDSFVQYEELSKANCNEIFYNVFIAKTYISQDLDNQKADKHSPSLYFFYPTWASNNNSDIQLNWIVELFTTVNITIFDICCIFNHMTAISLKIGLHMFIIILV